VNRTAARGLVSEAVIGVSLAAGIYLIGVEPVERAAATERTERDRTFVERSSFDAAQERRALAEMRGRAERIRQASSASADELASLARLNGAAAQAGVAVVSIEQRDAPRAADASAPAGPSVAGPVSVDASAVPPPPPPSERRAGFVVSVRGTYADVASFLRVLETGAGLARIESGRLTPAGDTANPLVELTMETTHLWFDTAPALRAIADAESALGEGSVRP
jgi:hypothetical protein